MTENLRSKSLGALASRWVQGAAELAPFLEHSSVIHTSYMLRRVQAVAQHIVERPQTFPEWLVEEATSFIRIHGWTNLTLDDIRKQKAYRVFAYYTGDEYGKLVELAKARGLTIPELTRTRMVELLNSTSRPKEWDAR